MDNAFLDEALIAGGCGWLLGKEYVCEADVCRVIAQGLAAMTGSTDTKVNIICREVNSIWCRNGHIVSDEGYPISEDELDPAELFPDGDAGRYIGAFMKRADGSITRSAPEPTAHRLQVMALGVQLWRFHRGLPLLRFP